MHVHTVMYLYYLLIYRISHATSDDRPAAPSPTSSPSWCATRARAVRASGARSPPTRCTAYSLQTYRSLPIDPTGKPTPIAHAHGTPDHAASCNTEPCLSNRVRHPEKRSSLRISCHAHPRHHHRHLYDQDRPAAGAPGVRRQRVTRQLPVAQDSVFRVRAQYIKCIERVSAVLLAYCTFRETSASLNDTHPRVKVQQPPRARR